MGGHWGEGAAWGGREWEGMGRKGGERRGGVGSTRGEKLAASSPGLMTAGEVTSVLPAGQNLLIWGLGSGVVRP